jgi:hypothetical protein
MGAAAITTKTKRPIELSFIFPAFRFLQLPK